MATEEKKEMQKLATKLSKFFKVEITISIFDKVIVHWIYPPQKEED